MSNRHSVWRAALVCALAAAALCTNVSTPLHAQRRRDIRVAAADGPEIRAWASTTDAMLRSGELRMRTTRADTLLPGRVIERADQYYRGVRVFGGDLARQVDRGTIVSIFGTHYPDIAIDTSPRISAARAREVVVGMAGMDQGADRQPELVVLPMDDGSYRLTWEMTAFTPDIDRIVYFVDAGSGEVVLHYSNRQTQSAVGRGTGVLGDSKKISATRDTGSSYSASDLLRPPVIRTYDLKGDQVRLDQFLSGQIGLTANDRAIDDDNVWTDGAVVDAHVYSGYTYDYYYKRFGRHGLDDRNIGIFSLVHPIHRDDVFALFRDYSDLFVNAFYVGNGIMVYGEGLPSGVTLGGQSFDYFSGALDIVAHELTHGVTEYTSNLIYRNESGALNEAFSDMMGTSAEFMFQPAGDGPMHADYLLSEDIARPGGFRSMADPGRFGDPDHYSKRYRGPEDNGGVHTNSGIANHAFYLAIEGGTNRTSGQGVQGVGGGNREQIEKVFYRAFTQLLPSNATFSMARAACIQAARDLYGSGSAPERAVTQAWSAVGVQ